MQYSLNQFKRKYALWDGIDILSWIVLFASAYFTEFQYHLIIPSLYLVLRGMGRRKAINTDLKNAVDYCRVKQSTREMILRGLAGIVFVVITYWAYDYIEVYLPGQNILSCGYLIFTGLIYNLFSGHLQNFTTGIRWYISGIKLPGERSLLIPWRHVSEVRAEEGRIHITVFNKQHVFRIHSKDYRSALHFVRWYEKKKAASQA